MRKYQKAVPERNRQVEAHRGFTESIDPADITKWTKMCEKWEEAKFPKDKVESPYHVEGTGSLAVQE